MRDRPVVALLGAVVLVATAGCAGTSNGAPIAATSTVGTSTEPGQSTTAGSPDRHGAPRVDNPLDATPYLTQPCAAISPRLRQSLTIPGDGEADTSSAIGSRAPSCVWSEPINVGNGETVSVAFLKANKNGLVDLYRGNDSRPEAYWEETTVQGYPGVFHAGVDSRSAGQCTFAVGLDDALAMSIYETGKLGVGSCERVKQVAAAVIQTLKGQG